MEGKQERRRKIERKERTRRRSAETRETELATTPSVAKEATTASAGNNRACSDGGYREDQGKGLGYLLDGTPIPWRWIVREIVMPVEVLGTWPATVETGAEGDQ